MKSVVLVLGGLIGVIIIVFLGTGILFRLLFWFSEPQQPKFGYTGTWRSFSAFGVEERPLPPAKEVWKDYSAWTPRTNEYGTRVYVARLGGTERQSRFFVSMSSGDTPMGATRSTHVDFIYDDPTNGTYFLHWSLRGKHNTHFLKFDDTYRLYQLQPYGDTNEYPPRLSIRAIEGIEPSGP